jgi:hypothetical protein
VPELSLPLSMAPITSFTTLAPSVTCVHQVGVWNGVRIRPPSSGHRASHVHAEGSHRGNDSPTTYLMSARRATQWRTKGWDERGGAAVVWRLWCGGCGVAAVVWRLWCGGCGVAAVVCHLVRRGVGHVCAVDVGGRRLLVIWREKERIVVGLEPAVRARVRVRARVARVRARARADRWAGARSIGVA